LEGFGSRTQPKAHFGACQLATGIGTVLPSYLLGIMTPEEHAEMERLCQLLQEEKDPNKFTQLVYQLNLPFKRKERRLNGDLLPRPRRVLPGNSASNGIMVGFRNL
jgi:hypothetical protein